MRFVRALNNNAGIATGDDGRDVIVFGKGLAFFLKRGDEVPAERIERMFREDDTTALEQLLNDIPQRYFDLSCEIIEYMQQQLHTTLGSSLYIALMDHVSFVHTRAERGMLPSNSLTWEICRYYPEEFKLGRKVVELLEDELGCTLNDDEAASIALHVINAENGLEQSRTSGRTVELIDDIMHIICFQAGVQLDTQSLSHQRLMTHVKFFVQRILRGGSTANASAPAAAPAASGAEPLAPLIRQSYPRAWSIADRVATFAEAECSVPVGDDETSYLAIHIHRVLAEGGAA